MSSAIIRKLQYCEARVVSIKLSSISDWEVLNKNFMALRKKTSVRLWNVILTTRAIKIEFTMHWSENHSSSKQLEDKNRFINELEHSVFRCFHGYINFFSHTVDNSPFSAVTFNFCEINCSKIEFSIIACFCCNFGSARSQDIWRCRRLREFSQTLCCHKNVNFSK